MSNAVPCFGLCAGCQPLESGEPAAAQRLCDRRKGHKGAHHCQDCGRLGLMRDGARPAKRRIGRPPLDEAKRRVRLDGVTVAPETADYLAATGIAPGRALDEWCTNARARESA
jgi:hypothetical protein